MTGKIVWITGASSGIGEALVYACVNAGARVVASARRMGELERVKTACGALSDMVTVLPLDVSRPETFETAVSQVLALLGRIDILINNAGASQRSFARETGLEVDRRVMEVNYFGQIALTKAVLPSMLVQGSGHFVVMSSLTGKFGFPKRSAYAAAKHALQGFFETLYLEERAQGIRVTIVNPGGIRTAISLHALTSDGGEFGKMDPLQEQGMSPEKCAALILQAVNGQRFEVAIGNPREKMALWLKRFFPRLLHRQLREE